ncbi:MAG: heme o synthase [Actinobacteria bacterium]|nr:heme o synthase [Actinomycetota bacterium]
MQKNLRSKVSSCCRILMAYISISKPRLVLLLYFTGFASAIVASSIYGFKGDVILLFSGAVILSVSGSNAATAYIDRDMDIVMSRTGRRPVPAGIISPARNALIYGLVLTAAGMALAAFINYLTSIFIFLGFLDSVVVYNAVSKKRSPFNVVIGAPAGGMPVLAGWAAVAGNKLDSLPILMFILVIVWTPMHIWSLAYFYKEDYKKAKVPMLPVVWNSKKVFILLAVLNLILVFFSLFIGLYFNLSILYLIVSSILGGAIIVLSIMLIAGKTKKTAWILFKFSSPYLAVIFFLLIIEYIWI